MSTFIDLEAANKDAEQKGKYKLYADEQRKAKYSNVDVKDKVLVRQEKVDKFTTPFNKAPHTVVVKNGNKVTVESPTGTQYSQNTTSVKKSRINKKLRKQGQEMLE